MPSKLKQKNNLKSNKSDKVSSNGTEDVSTAGYTAYEGGANRNNQSNRQDSYRQNQGNYSNAQKQSQLQFLKIVENGDNKTAGTGQLPGPVLAIGGNHNASEKSDYQQTFDQNWNPALGHPNYKISRTFFFGGMKKALKIPISMPNRIIIEPNPPRQGYSHLTWNTLNQYYLQKCMTQKQYEEILVECKKIAFKVYAINREENKFLKNTLFMKLSNVVWIFCIVSVIILFLGEITDNLVSELIIQIFFSISIGLVFIMSIFNFLQKPPQNIFINYEKFLRQQLQKIFQVRNQQNLQLGNGLKFDVAQNDCLWLEIQIPKHHQMPLDESQIQKHLDYLNKRAQDEDGEMYVPIQLYQVVNSQQEADDHNAKMQKIFDRNNLVSQDYELRGCNIYSQNDDKSRTLSSDTAIQPKKDKKQQKNYKIDVSMEEDSFNDKRMASQSALKAQQKEYLPVSKKPSYLSPRDRIKARNAQLEKDNQEFNESRQSRANQQKREQSIDSINVSPSARDFQNDVIRSKNVSGNQNSKVNLESLRKKM